jgi:hypothetical protein
MRVSEYLDFPPMRVAVVAFVLALAFAAWSLIAALRDPPAPATPARSAGAIALTAVPAPTVVDIDAAVASDLFAPDRAAPDEPFRMPGEASSSSVVQQAAERPTVLGTAVSTNGFSFATAQLSPGSPRIVREGDRLGQYTVRRIERGHVVFTTSDGARLDIAATAASTQDSFNAQTAPMFPAFDSADDRGFARRGAARGRGRATRDTVPH